MKSVQFISVLFLGVKFVECDERCSPSALAHTVAVCCGARPDTNKEPLLYATFSSGYLTYSSRSSTTPSRCTTVTGLVLVPPESTVCCPGPHGRLCCYAAKTRTQPGTSRWLFQSSESDFATYLMLSVFVLLVMATFTLVAYCCQAVIERSRNRRKRNGYVELRNEPSTSRSSDLSMHDFVSYQNPVQI